MNIKLFTNNNYYKNIYKKDNNGREINIYKYLDCYITGYNIYYPNILLYSKHTNNLILPVIEKTMSLNMGTIYEKNDMKYDLDINSLINVSNIIEEPVFYFVYNTDNYYHYLYDTLPYLITYLNLKKEIPNIKLLMQYSNVNKKEFYKFVLEFLELLDIKNEDILIINDITLYKQIYISTSYTHDFNSNLPPRNEIYELYKNLSKKVIDKFNTLDIYNKIPKKIYVSRRSWLHNDYSNIGTNYTLRRKLVNEDEIVEMLLKDGFEEVFTEKLSTIEKILYFANAEYVIGAIGGGISNVLFSPKTTKLNVLVSPTFLDVNYRFRYCLDCVDVTYNYNSRHIENTEFKKYMRVKTKDNKIIGEIEDIDIVNSKLIISYTNDNVTGWNANNIYIKKSVDFEDVIKLDDGLNSQWIILNY